MVVRRAHLSSTTSSSDGSIAAATLTPAARARFSRTLQSSASEMHQHLPLATIASVMSSPASPPLSPTTTTATSTAGRAIDEAHRCRYKTGKCYNARSSKRNGQPHQLCLYHRDKANQIQRKFDRQKRQVMRERKGSSSSSTGSLAALAAPSAVSRYQQQQQQQPHVLAGMHHRSHLQLHYIHQQHRSPNSSSTSGSSVHNITNFAPRFTSLAAKDVDLYSDSDASSRFSTDSSSSDASAASSLWADLPSPVSAAAFMELRLTPLAVPSPTTILTAPSPASSTPGSALGVTPTATDATPTQTHSLTHDEIDFLCFAMLE